MGIDRMTMFLSNTDNIKEVLLFPAMKPQENVPAHHAAENAAAAAAHPATAAAAASSSAPAAAAPAAGKMGGIKAAKPADDTAKSVLTRALPAIVAKLPRLAGKTAEVVSYSTQVVAGTNYFLKIQFEGEVVHARVFINLQQEVTLHSVQENKTLESAIEYF